MLINAVGGTTISGMLAGFGSRTQMLAVIWIVRVCSSSDFDERSLTFFRSAIEFLLDIDRELWWKLIAMASARVYFVVLLLSKYHRYSLQSFPSSVLTGLIMITPS